MPSKPVRRAAARGERSSADVDTLLASSDHPQVAVIRAVRAVILAAAPGVREGVKWNAPSFATTGDFATFHLRSKSGVQVVLHLGARPRPDAGVRAGVADPARLLEWRGPDRATVTFHDLADADAKAAAFAAILRQWVAYVE